MEARRLRHRFGLAGAKGGHQAGKLPSESRSPAPRQTGRRGWIRSFGDWRLGFAFGSCASSATKAGSLSDLHRNDQFSDQMSTGVKNQQLTPAENLHARDAYDREHQDFGTVADH